MKSKANMQWLKSLLKQFPTYHRRSWLSAFSSSVLHGMRWKCWQGWCHSCSVLLLWDTNISTDTRDENSCVLLWTEELTAKDGWDSDSTGPWKKQDMDMGTAPEKQTEHTAMVCLQKESSVRKNNWLKPMALTRTFHQGTKRNTQKPH